MANIITFRVQEREDGRDPETGVSHLSDEVVITTKTGDKIVLLVSSEGWAIEVNGEVVKER